MPRASTPESRLAAHVHALPTQYLECQVTGKHRLPPVTDPDQTKFRKQRSGTFQQISHCEWCGTKVTKIVAASGYLDDIEGHPGYEHPEGYLRPQDTMEVPRKDYNAMLRREARRRNEEARREAVKLAAVSMASPERQATVQDIAGRRAKEAHGGN